MNVRLAAAVALSALVGVIIATGGPTRWESAGTVSAYTGSMGGEPTTAVQEWERIDPSSLGSGPVGQIGSLGNGLPAPSDDAGGDDTNIRQNRVLTSSDASIQCNLPKVGERSANHTFVVNIEVTNHTSDTISDLYAIVTVTRELYDWKDEHRYGRFNLGTTSPRTASVKFQSLLPGDGYEIKCELFQHREGLFGSGFIPLVGWRDRLVDAKEQRFGLADYEFTKSYPSSRASLTSCTASTSNLQVGDKVRLRAKGRRKQGQYEIGRWSEITFIQIFKEDRFVDSHPEPRGMFGPFPGFNRARKDSARDVHALTYDAAGESLLRYEFEPSSRGLYTAYCFMHTGPPGFVKDEAVSTSEDLALSELGRIFLLAAAATMSPVSATALAGELWQEVYKNLFSTLESVKAVHFCVGDPAKDCKFYSEPGQPDLELESLSPGKTTLKPGESFTLTANVRNVGTETSSETTMNVFRSSWPPGGGEEDHFAEPKLTAIPASDTEKVFVEFAASETAGEHGYTACVVGASDESNIANNCSDEVRITVEEPDPGSPDLVVYFAGVTKATVEPEGRFGMNAGVLNRGDVRSSKTELRYYRSEDSTISVNDTQVGPTNEEVEPLDPSETDHESARLTVPEVAGDYYYGACVVPLPSESDANNNCSTGVLVTVIAGESGKPDLVVESPSVSASELSTGDSFHLSATVRNSGDGSSQKTKLRYYRSTDSTITTDDEEVETDRVLALDPSGIDHEREELTATGAGDYYYGACVDPVSNESNTNNNCSGGVEVTIGGSSQGSPDLVVYSPSIYEKSFDPGERFNMAFWVRNEGDGPSNATASLKYYRSSDATISYSDTEITIQSGTSQVGPISATGRSTVSVYLDAHSIGTYYYGACVGIVTGESDTRNNCSAVFRVTLASPDLVVQSPSVSNNSPGPGGSFTLSATVHNQGDSEAASTTLRYYRSSDATITSSDTPAGTDNLSNLGPNKSSRESISLSAQSNPGKYYYGACVESVSGESDTQNNCSSSVAVTVTGTSQTPPDLVVQTPTVNDSSVEPGDSFTLRATVLNQGVGSSDSTVLRYYRSTDSTISITDTSVGTDNVSGLGANGTSSESISLTAPSNIGTYYYGACVDVVVGESSTQNNCSSAVAVTVATATSGDPDLRAHASVSESILRTGDSFTLRARVSNQGNRGGGTSAATTLRYYRSTDSTITSADTELGTSAVGILGRGQGISLSIDLTAPAVARTYYYGACVDSVPGESDTQNNCTAGVEVTVEDTLPDLVVESPSVSKSNLQTGESFTLRTTVRNQGDGTSSSTTIRYYRSTDSTITTSDAFLDTDGVRSLGSGATSSESVGLTAPTSAGTYYYGACVDSVSGESNTQNNCSAGVEVTVAGTSQASPDLVVQSPMVSDSNVKVGGALTVTVTVHNQGDGSSPATTLQYYLSSNSTIRTSDGLQGTATVASLEPSQSSSFSIDLTAPGSAGTEYYGACVVSVSGESNTQNNCSVGVEVTVEAVYPDLVVDTPTVADSTLETGEEFRLNATVRNQGDGRSPRATTLRYYSSTDSTISTSDTEVGTDDVGRVRPSSTDSNYILLTAPASAGTLYYGACVDAVQQESNTQNNCSGSVEVTVTQGNPDLVVQSPSVDDSNPAAGTVIRLSATVNNQGDRSSPATTLRYYRSTDSSISTSDIEAGTDPVRSLEPSQTSNESFDLTAPASAGTHYYGACVDSVTGESDTGNNCSTGVEVTVTGTATTAPDLVVESPSVDDKHLDPDDSRKDDFRITVTVRNQGDGASPQTTLRYYRSTDSTITTSDTEVETETVSSLGASETDEGSERIDSPTSAGTYYYGACVDSVTGESDTGNNCSTGVEVIVSKVGEGNPDLVVQSPTVSSNNVEAGTSITLGATVRNQGTGRSPETDLRYYRSADSTITTGDTRVESDSVDSLGPTETGAESDSLLAPGDAGTYYYGACVDSVARESNTQNNCSAGVSVVVTGSAEVGPDLVVESPSVNYSRVAPGETFDLSVTVRNQGNVESNNTTLRYYRSTDSTISTTDSELETDSVSSLDPNETGDEDDFFDTPETEGTYYYGACVDSVTDETDTSNNCSAGVKVTVIGIDLVVESPSVDDSNLEAGESFTLSVTVRNQGGEGERSRSTTLRYYRSTDSSISSSDTEVGTDSVTSLSANDTSDESITLTAPATSGTYTYYYGACVDSETDESVTNNNCSSGVAVTVTGESQGNPDLVVQSPSVSDSTLGTGDSFTLRATVRNVGDGSSSATTVRYYRSSDSTITSSDTGVGTDSVSALAPSATESESISVNAPSSSGTYYYGACVDSVTGESDTNNNCSDGVAVFVQSVGNFDLVVSAFSVRDTVVEPGSSVRPNATVRNDGTGRSIAFGLLFYRSTDSTISDSDTIEAFESVVALNSGETSSERDRLTAPSTPGTYYYGVCIPDNIPGELNTQNNCSAGVRVTVT